MAQMVGADVTELRELAAAFDKGSQHLRTVESSLSWRIRSAPWHGSDVELFLHEWDRSYRKILMAAAAALTESATHLRHQAEQQQMTSGADSSFGSMIPGLPGLGPFRGPIFRIPEDAIRHLIDELRRRGLLGPNTATIRPDDFLRLIGFDPRIEQPFDMNVIVRAIRRSGMFPGGPSGPIDAAVLCVESIGAIAVSGAIGAAGAIGAHGLWSGSGSLGGAQFRGEAEGFAGIRGEADANASFNFKDGGRVHAGVSGMAGAEGHVAGSADYGLLHAEGNAAGFAGVRGQAQIDGSVGLDGARISAGGEVFAGAEGHAEASVGLPGVKATGGLSGYAGIGVHANADASVTYDEVKISLSAGAAVGLGFGADASIEFSPKDIVDNAGRMADGAGRVMSDVGRGAQDAIGRAGEGLQHAADQAGQALHGAANVVGQTTGQAADTIKKLWPF